MAPLKDHLHQLLVKMVNLTAPEWYINPAFRAILGREAAAIMAAAPTLTFAHGLQKVFRADARISIVISIACI
ncbi:hypothetical protein Q7P36_004079 [Cladosporium allicinum]